MRRHPILLEAMVILGPSKIAFLLKIKMTELMTLYAGRKQASLEQIESLSNWTQLFLKTARTV